MDVESHWLNKTQMSKSLGISPQAFSAWGVAPVAKKGRENFYTVADVLANREDRWSNLGGSDDPDAEERKIRYQLARTRLTNEQADGLALKNEVARHEVAPFDFLRYLLGKIGNEIAGVHDGLPAQAMRQLKLTVEQAGTLRGILARAGDSIANLGREDWIEKVLDEFISETDFKL